MAELDKFVHLDAFFYIKIQWLDIIYFPYML